MKPSQKVISQDCVRRLGTTGAIILTTILLAGSAAQAATTYSWNVTSDYYTNSAAWNPPGVPGILDTASIGNYGTALHTDTMTNKLTSMLLGNGGDGALTMSGGELDITNTSTTAFIMGNTANNATFQMDGGVLNIARPSTSNRYFQDSFFPGSAAGSVCTFTLNNGRVNVLCGLEAGNYGSATITVNGGTMMANGWVDFGLHGSGTFNLNGGTVYVLKNQGLSLGGFRLQQYSGSTGKASITGGTLYAPQINLGMAAGTGSFDISGGTIYLGDGGVVASGSSVSNINLSGGTFRTVNMDPNNSGQMGLTSILTGGTNWTWSSANMATINLTNSPGPGTVTFVPDAGKTITLNAPMAGPGSLVVNGPGTVALGAANTYTGGTTILQGTLALNNNGAVVDSTLNLPSGTRLSFSAGSGTQYFTNNVTGTGDVFVTLGGNGVEMVTGSLGHSGQTVVSTGTLALGAALNSSSAVTVTNTGTLAGVGPIAAPVSVRSTTPQGAHLRMGMSPLNLPDTLTVNNNLSLGANSELDVKLGTATTVGGGVNDLLVVNGNLTIDSSAVVNVIPLQQLTAGTYVIATYTGTLTGTFNPTVTGLTRYGFALDYSTAGQIKLTVSGTVPNLVWRGTNTTWDVLGAYNWTNASGNKSQFYEGDAVTFDGTATNFNVSITTTVYPASITINGDTNYSIAGAGNGHISGGTGITKNGNGTTLLFSGPTLGNDYTGPVQINGGILQLADPNCLGSTNGGTTVADGGTLDLNGNYPRFGGEPLVLQGAGLGGTNGALMNSGSNLSLPGLGNVMLAGDTLVNTPGRLDFGNNNVTGGSFQGNGHTLTKIGSGQLYFYDFGETGLGDINVLGGQLGFQRVVTMGDPAKTCTIVGPAASLRFYQVTNILDKHLVLTNAATLDTTSGSNNFVGPITLWQTNNINMNAGLQIVLGGPIGGSGGFNKGGSGTLYLNGANTYTGPTFLNQGNIILGTGGSISGSSLITLAGGTLLDASLPAGGLSLGKGMTLAGSGTVAGNVSAGTGARLSPGTAIGAATLTLNNNLTLNNATNIIKLSGDPYTIGSGVNDLISVAGSLNLSGVSTIQIKPIGLLSSSSPYTVMQYDGVTPPSLANLRAVSTSARYGVSVLNPSITAPYIQVSITGNPGALVWKGGATINPDRWDNAATNWLNLGTGLRDVYIPGDNAIFDDTATVHTINVATPVMGAITLSNNATAYTLTGNGLISASLDAEGTGSLSLAVSNPPALSAITANSGSLIFDVQGVSTYTNAAPISDNGAGQGTIVKVGTNTLVLQGNNTAFYGAIVVTNGTLQYTNNAALGYYTAPLYVTNQGTLDLNHTVAGYKNIVISGAGFNGQGAVNNSGAQLVTGGVESLTLAGDATIGAFGARWNVQDACANCGGVLNGNGHNLTKVGPQVIFVVGCGETGLGNIDVAAGRLGFQDNVTLGIPTATLTVESNATLSLFGLANSLQADGGLNKILVLNNGSILDNAGGSNNFDGPVTLVGTSNLFGLRTDLHLWNSVGGAGGLVVGQSPVGGGGGNLWLEGANFYTGPTIINSGHGIVVGASSSLGNSSLIEVDGGARLDVSALAALNLGAGQTLIGAGTNIGNIVIGSGATLAPGFPDSSTYTLTIRGNLTLQAGSTNVVVVKKGTNVATDTVTGLTNVTLAGTLVINSVGNALANGDAIRLFTATNYLGSGFNNIIPATPGANLVWDTSTLLSDGTLRVLRNGPPTNPTNIVVSASANQVTLSWPTDYTGWTLQAQTNAPGLGLTTTWYDVPGSATTNLMVMPIDATQGSVFYRMVLH